MRIYIVANPGSNPKYIFEDMDEKLLRLLNKSLYTNFLQNNFKDDDEEELCENMLTKLATIVPIERQELTL